MAISTNLLHLVVPGLLGPLPRGVEAGALPSVPHLEGLFGRARRTPEPGGHLAVLFHLFGWQRSPEGDWPSGAASRCGEGAVSDGDWWCHADPVSVRPDMDRLMVFDARDAGLSADEIAELLALVNGHFAEDGWRLEMAPAGGWYLRVGRAPRVVSCPLHVVAGRSMYPFLPRGADQTAWRGALNEVQMLLHHSRVNERRRNRGRPEINGLWLWGGGRAQRPGRPTELNRVCADQHLARGLAVLAGLEVAPVPRDPGEFPGGKGCLMVRDELLVPLMGADVGAWAEGLVAFDDWLQRLWPVLRRVGVDWVLLFPGNGQRYDLSTRGRWLPWPRRLPLRQLLADAPDEISA